MLFVGMHVHFVVFCFSSLSQLRCIEKKHSPIVSVASIFGLMMKKKGKIRSFSSFVFFDKRNVDF